MNLLLRVFMLCVLLLAVPAWAEAPGCCAGCGNCCKLKAVCRLVCETKTVKEVCYDCECEDFCTPGPSKKCGETCERDCHGHTHKKILWKPSCGHVHHRRVLVKHEIEKEVPHYKCVVEYVCTSCCCQAGRVPCDQANQVSEKAARMNLAAEGSSPATEAAPRRNLLSPVLFAK